MERMTRSAARVALPVSLRNPFCSPCNALTSYDQAFDADALLELIKLLVMIDSRWVPQSPGCSLYVRPTLIGTRPCKSFPLLPAPISSRSRVTALGVAASDEAMLYVILSPTGPYFRTGAKAIRLLAVGEHVRSWPGGTAGYKLGINYPACFSPQQEAEIGRASCRERVSPYV